MVVSVGSIFDDGEHQALTDELDGQVVGLLTIDGGGTIHEPVGGGLAGEGMTPPAITDPALPGHLDADHAVMIIAEGVGVGRVGGRLGVGTVGTDEAPEDDLDGGALHGQLVGDGVPFQVDEVHAIPGRVDGVDDVALVDAVPLTEPTEDVQALGRQLPDSALEGEDGRGLTVGRLDETGVHEALTDGTGHLAGHGEGGGGGGGDDAGGILGIGHPIRLRELERAQVVDGLLRGEGVFDALESNAMGTQRQTDHQGREEIHEVLMA